jgi:hypothetical protein
MWNIGKWGNRRRLRNLEADLITLEAEYRYWSTVVQGPVSIRRCERLGRIYTNIARIKHKIKELGDE